MKKIQFFILLIMLLLSITDDAEAQSKNKTKDDVGVVQPCSGKEYMSNDQFLRATGTGLSADMNMATKKSMAVARSEIVITLETCLATFTANYVTSFQNGGDDTKQHFEDITRKAAKQILEGTRTICNDITKTSDGKYKACITLELTGKDVFETMVNAIMKDEKIKADFKYDKFKAEFDKEMKKYADED